MAVTGDINEFLNKIDDDFVSCPICREQYKDPKILPCLHTFCQRCLITSVKKHGDLKCFTCQRTCQLSDGDVQELTSNLFMKSLVDLIVERRRLQLQTIQIVCESCDKEETTKVCLECPQYFCDTCMDTGHNRMKALRSHRVVPVCTECTIIEHKNPEHSYRDLKDAAGEYRRQLEQTVQTLKDKEKNELHIKQGIKENIKRGISERCDREKKKVEERTEEIIGKVRQEEKRLKEELEQQYELRLKHLAEEIDDLKVNRENISDTCTYVDTLMHHGNDVHMLSTKQLTTARADELVAMEFETNDYIKSDVEFISCDKMDKNDRLGEIRCDVDVRKCTIEIIPKQIIKGESVDIVVTTNDNLGRPVLPRQPIKVKPDPPLEKLSMVDNCDGTHVVTINGTSAGEYRVTMEINNQPIPGSPIEIHVTEGLVKTLGCKCSKDEQFNNPKGVAMNNDGNIAVADTDNNRVQIIDIDSRKCLKTFKFPGYKYNFIPYDVAVSADNDYYMTDQGNNQIVISNDNGECKGCFGHNDLDEPCGISISPVNGNVYVTNYKPSKVIIYTPNGRQLRVIRGKVKGHEYLYGPRYITINDLGMIFVSDSRQCIQVFNAKFEFLYTCGSKGNGDGQFSFITGVYANDKYVYACDYGNNTVQKFDICGSFLCRIDNYSDGLKCPEGIVLTNDTPQKIVVVDYGHNCIRIFVE
ncbi:tripartite motif-containing protein 2-like [Glandiceps talaboti]